MINKLNKIYTIIIYLNIVLLNIFVGSTHNAPKTILETTIILEFLIYLIISKLQKKENIIIKGKIDIAVTLMAMVTAMPVIFKTYCSLSDTIDIFIEYLTIYSMYIMTRNLITTPKRKNIFINIILLSSCLIIIFGIDRLNFNIFQKFYDITNSAQVEERRMVSTIGYSNAVFAYIVSLMFIAIGKFLETDSKKIAGTYAMYVGFAMYAFYYCNSRAGMIIFAVMFIIYLIGLKDINKIIDALVLVIFSYMEVAILDKIDIVKQSSIGIMLAILTTLITIYILSFVLKKTNKKIKSNKKTIMSLIVGIIAILSIYVLVAQNFSKPIEMKSEYDGITLMRLKPNTEYKIKIDYTLESQKPIRIKLVQYDNKRNKTVLYKNTINTQGENQTEEFSVKTSDVDYACVEFYTSKESKLTFNKIYINGKEEVINFKYLPQELMRLIQTLHTRNISIVERISMYKSGLKLFTLHPIVGNGAKTYENMYTRVREYAYSTMEVHSYYLDILMDYGIIGLTVCLSIIGITIFNFIKRSNKNNILNKSIFFGWMFVAVHTIIDFDLAYLLTLTNFFMMIALICEEDKNIKIKCKILEDSIIIILIPILIFNFMKIHGERLEKNGKYKEAMVYIPYSESNNYLYIKKQLYTDSLEENMKIIIRYLSNEKNSKQFEIIRILENMSICSIESGRMEIGMNGLNKILDMIDNNEILAKNDIVYKEQWTAFEAELENEMTELGLK